MFVLWLPDLPILISFCGTAISMLELSSHCRLIQGIIQGNSMPLIFWHLFLTMSANCLSDYFCQFLYFYWSSMEHPAPAISLLMYYIIVYNCRDLFCCLHPFLLSLLCKFSSSPLNLSLVYGSSTCLLFMMDFLFSFHHFLLPCD